MSVRHIVMSAGTLGFGQGFAQLLSLIRNVVVARMLGPDQFGVAACLILVAHLADAASDLSIEKMLVQADDGENERFQRTLHLLQFCRGIVMAGVLLLIANPAASLLGVPEAAIAFRWLALGPLFKGMAHLDVRRWERRLRFTPGLVIEVVAQATLTIGAWILCRNTPTHESVLILLVAQHALATIGSHAWAERPYRWAIDRDIVIRVARFGWPLVCNGLLIWLITRGDQGLIGMFYSTRELGLFSVAFGIVAAPILLASRVSATFLLPLFSKYRDNADRTGVVYRHALHILVASGSVIATVWIVAGPATIVALFGAEYAEAARVLGWLALAQSMRLIRIAPVLAAMAHGDTHTALRSNLARSTSLAIGCGAAIGGAALEWIVVADLVGECLALLVAGRRVSRLHVRGSSTILPAALGLASAMAVMMAATANRLGPTDVISMRVAIVVAAAILIMLIVVARDKSGRFRAAMGAGS